MSINLGDRVKTVKRTYMMVRVFCPGAAVPIQSFIFDEDEVEAYDELVELCIMHNVAYEVETLRPH